MSVSVLDFIPVGLHAGIAAGTDTSDLTAYFQAAAAASVSAAPAPADHAHNGSVFVPNGLYHLNSIGIRGVRVIGESTSGAIVRAFSPGSAYLFDAMYDVDGTTFQQYGGGWCENLTLDGRLPDSETRSGRSGLRTYSQNATQRLWVQHLEYGVSLGLPMWSTIRDVYALCCNVGFYTFCHTEGQAGTSTTFLNCWANKSGTYGFHITQLHYSSFVNCCAQASGDENQLGGVGWYFQGDARAPGEACVDISLIGCANEGGDIPFLFRRCLQLTVNSPRIIGTVGVPRNRDLMTFDESDGTVIELSAEADPGYFSLAAAGPPLAGRSIVVVGGRVDWHPASDARFTRVGTVVGATPNRTTSSDVFRVNGDDVVGQRRTGWQIPTGTADRTTFDPATVGLVPLAQRVKALIDDLTGHGLIGA